MEFCADIYIRAKTIGEPNILSNEQISEVIEKFLSSYSTQK
jgi:L-fuculose-phosphate aldolase